MSSRLQARHIGGVVRGGFHYVSQYLRDSEGASPQNLAHLDKTAALIKSLKGPWVIAGDLNMPPEVLKATGFIEFIDGVVIAIADPTCGDQCFDYFIVARSFAHAVAGISLVSDGGFNPHSPVRLFLRTDARADAVRRPAAARRFTPERPTGCLPEVACIPMEEAAVKRAGRDGQDGCGGPEMATASAAVTLQATATGNDRET